MTDIVERLRASVTQCRALDRSELLTEAADTIDRQNREVSVLLAECQRQKDLLVNGARLTDAERVSLQWVVGDALSVDGISIQATLRGLLERTK